MHSRAAMISKKAINKILKSGARTIAAMPAIPYITKRKSSMVMPFVLGGLGVALMGGMAAVMFLSPRTRYRALDVAKNTYGKLESQINPLISQIREKAGIGAETAMDGHSNGLANGHSNGLSNGVGSSYTTTGL